MPKEKVRALLIARRATVSDLRPRGIAILSDIGIALEGHEARRKQLFAICIGKPVQRERSVPIRGAAGNEQ